MKSDATPRIRWTYPLLIGLLLSAGLSLGQSCISAPADGPASSTGDAASGGSTDLGGGGPSEGGGDNGGSSDDGGASPGGVTLKPCLATVSSGVEQQLEASDASAVVSWTFTMNGSGSGTVLRPSDREILGQLSVSGGFGTATVPAAAVGGNTLLFQAIGAGVTYTVTLNGSSGPLGTCITQVQ